MITLRQHVKLMEFIQSGGLPDDFIKDMKPLEALSFSRSLKTTYPVKENIKPPTVNKRFHTTIESLVLGQFIMLEQIITGKTKLADHLVDLEIAKLVIRPSHHEVFDNENPRDEKQNQEDILNMDVREVYWVLDNFIENRNKTLFKDFSGVFYDVSDDEEDEEKEDQSDEDKTADLLFSQQWYWYSIVRMLSGEDIHKYADTYMLSMQTVLPEMSYLAQKNKIESAKQRQAAAMRKL